MDRNTSKINNIVYWVINKFANCVMVTILWFVFCIPIITIGASSAAMYSTVHRVIRHDRDTTWSNFWRTFKTYFKKTTCMWLILLAVLAFSVLGWLMTYAALVQGAEMGIYNPLFYIPMLYVLVLSIYVFSYVIRFDTDARHIMKTSAALAVMKLHWTLLMLIITAAGVVCIAAFPISVFFMPAVVCIFYDLILEKIFRSIMRPEDLQKELEREERERRERDS